MVEAHPVLQNKLVNITRTEIIGRLVELSRLHSAATRGGIGGQVSALMGLAKIMGKLIDPQLNQDEFYRGWSEEDLLEYATKGTPPHRLTTGPSQGA